MNDLEKMVARLWCVVSRLPDATLGNRDEAKMNGSTG